MFFYGEPTLKQLKTKMSIDMVAGTANIVGSQVTQMGKCYLLSDR